MSQLTKQRLLTTIDFEADLENWRRHRFKLLTISITIIILIIFAGIMFLAVRSLQIPPAEVNKLDLTEILIPSQNFDPTLDLHIARFEGIEGIIKHLSHLILILFKTLEVLLAASNSSSMEQLEAGKQAPT
ncbi:hypothetical protein PV325_002876 [Microctonus aethiopoides]|nr:hypothetical protein PV325_002876 [Microctonus aethiopoides]